MLRNWPELQPWRPDKASSCHAFWVFLLRGGSHCCRPALAWHQALLLLLVMNLHLQKKTVFTVILMIIKLNVLALNVSGMRKENILRGRINKLWKLQNTNANKKLNPQFP